MSNNSHKDLYSGKMEFSKKLELSAEQEPDLHSKACMYEKAAQNSVNVALFSPTPRLKAVAKDTAVRQYLNAIDGFIGAGDFFRANSNFESLMDLYPRLSRKIRNELDALERQWIEAQKENVVPSIDISMLKNSMRK